MVILESVSKEELELLMKLVELFCMVVEHTSVNRMTSQALATSCGLSFFPQFKIGEASLLVLHFIEQSDVIKEKLHGAKKETKQKSPHAVTPEPPE